MFALSAAPAQVLRRPHRSLIVLAIMVAMATAVPVAAEMSKQPPRHGTFHAKPPTTPDHERVGFKPARAPGLAPLARGDHRAYSREIAEAAARYAVPARLVWAVIQAESGFNPRAVSKKGAQGLMQLMPETASILGVRNSFDPRENIDGGARHLRALLARFGNNLRLTVAAYNVGEKTVMAYGGIPPYPETREYVTQVLRSYSTLIEWRQLPGSGIHQIIEPDGTVIYTNIPPATGVMGWAASR